MNVARIAVLGVAAIAAGAAALLVNSMLGGAPAPVEASAPPPPVLSEVLVASTTVPPGRKLDVGSVRWDSWPIASVAPNFITKEKQPDTAKAVEGIVVRSPLVAGQPITELNTVRTDATGFLAATLMPGMRAVATNVTAESSAGGFVLPNDRVDVILTHEIPAASGSGGQNVKLWAANTILRDVRVLAVDQIAQPQSVPTTATDGAAAAAVTETDARVGKTVTLEVTPGQAELLQRAVASGNISLALRSLEDSNGRALTGSVGLGGGINSSTVVRFGIVRAAREIAGR
jgi:pilus assembly protein CpaB